MLCTSGISCPGLCGSFHLAQDLRGLIHTAVCVTIPLFPMVESIPQYGFDTFCFSIQLSRCMWLWTWVYTYLFRFLLSGFLRLRPEFLNCVVILGLIFKELPHSLLQWLCHFIFPPAMHGFRFSHVLAQLLFYVGVCLCDSGMWSGSDLHAPVALMSAVISYTP